MEENTAHFDTQIALGEIRHNKQTCSCNFSIGSSARHLIICPHFLFSTRVHQKGKHQSWIVVLYLIIIFVCVKTLLTDHIVLRGTDLFFLLFFTLKMGFWKVSQALWVRGLSWAKVLTGKFTLTTSQTTDDTYRDSTETYQFSDKSSSIDYLNGVTSVS